ncbi:Hypothetical_protein [Hexamita inflata]|uniref:Hypothetical_protein n=1 Tax=Hexamita inflata TaxID=28002 RepID=A0AA86U3I0_9EUKA|nr:Hypothetical protein HINF_LOCUS17283 [Hexamita inflata]
MIIRFLQIAEHYVQLNHSVLLSCISLISLCIYIIKSTFKPKLNSKSTQHQHIKEQHLDISVKPNQSISALYTQDTTSELISSSSSVNSFDETELKKKHKTVTRKYKWTRLITKRKANKILNDILDVKDLLKKTREEIIQMHQNIDVMLSTPLKIPIYKINLE